MCAGLCLGHQLADTCDETSVGRPGSVARHRGRHIRV
jgi:hypothetical protein